MSFRYLYVATSMPRHGMQGRLIPVDEVPHVRSPISHPEHGDFENVRSRSTAVTPPAFLCAAQS